MNEASLPKGFEELEPWVGTWVLENTQARSDRRQTSSFDELSAFYDALLPQAERALVHLSGFQLGALPGEEARLLKLLLALAEITPAIEWYRQPSVVDGLAAERFPAAVMLPDTESPTGR